MFCTSSQDFNKAASDSNASCEAHQNLIKSWDQKVEVK